MKKKPLFVVWITITRCRQCVRCNYLLYLIDVAVQLVYSLITSLLIILLARPEVLDRFHCTEDVAPVKPAGGHNTTAVFEKQNHVIVLSLKSLDKGLFVCSSCVCLSVLALHCSLETLLGLHCCTEEFVAVCVLWDILIKICKIMLFKFFISFEKTIFSQYCYTVLVCLHRLLPALFLLS